MNVLHGILASILSNLHTSFKLVWSVISPILLPLITVVIVLVLGLWIAGFLGGKIGVVIKKVKVDEVLDKIILSHFSKLAGVKVSASGLIGEAIHWFLTAIVLIAVLNLAHMANVVDFFKQALGYLPHVVVAALIVAVGAVLADFVAYILKFVTKSKNWIVTASLAVNVFALIAALGHLITPLAGSVTKLLGQLGLSGTQGNALFIGVLVLILLASKNVVTKTIEKLY